MYGSSKYRRKKHEWKKINNDSADKDCAKQAARAALHNVYQ